MKNWRSDNLNQSAFEKTGAIPRSIARTFEKFKKEWNFKKDYENPILEETINVGRELASKKLLLF